jgi:hypothetical protein
LSEKGEKKEKKPVKLEEVAEETGELVGKGVKKTWKVMKSFGKGISEGIEGKEKQKDTSTCPYCSALIPQDSKFCVSCGKKL